MYTLETPWYGCVVRVTNVGPMEFPIKASSSNSISQEMYDGEMGDDPYAARDNFGQPLAVLLATGTAVRAADMAPTLCERAPRDYGSDRYGRVAPTGPGAGYGGDRYARVSPDGGGYGGDRYGRGGPPPGGGYGAGDRCGRGGPPPGGGYGAGDRYGRGAPPPGGGYGGDRYGLRRATMGLISGGSFSSVCGDDALLATEQHVGPQHVSSAISLFCKLWF